jgi:hypothetical protein
MPDREMGSGDLTASCGRQFVLPYRGGRPLGGVQELPVGHFAQRTREDDEHLLFDLLTDLYAQGYRPLHEEEESRRSPRVKARAFFNALLREAESREETMCDVCCANRAVDAAKTGDVARFVWNPEAETGGLANNPDAPPLESYTLTPAEWPFVLVQAETDEWHVEGKGRWRFGFDSNDMGEWIESTYLSVDIDNALGVSWSWDWLTDDLKRLLTERDRLGILRLVDGERSQA